MTQNLPGGLFRATLQSETKILPGEEKLGIPYF